MSDYIQYKKQRILWNDPILRRESGGAGRALMKQFYVENTVVNTVPVYSQLVPVDKLLVFGMEKPTCPYSCLPLDNKEKRLFDIHNHTTFPSISSRHANTSSRVLYKFCPFFKKRVPSIKGNYCIPSKI